MKGVSTLIAFLTLAHAVCAQELSIAGLSDRTVEIRLGPAGTRLPPSPLLVEVPREDKWHGPVPNAPHALEVGELQVEIVRSPLTISVRRKGGALVQRLAWQADAGLSFKTDAPVFGLGENGSKLDRRGVEYPMIPQRRGGTQGSIVPSPLLIGTDGWALFIPQPQGSFDLRGGSGMFVPEKSTQSLQCFVIAWKQPADVLAEYVRLTGRPVMPPKWALGYMQSHRTLGGWNEVQQVAATLREKKLPCDALIYLSEVYCPSGWGNGKAPFSWNAANFPDPAANLAALHEMDYKVVLHATRYPLNLHGDSVSEASADPGHIANYWNQHVPIHHLGVDGWWPDNGDNLNDVGRLARHRLYFEGPLSLYPNKRPWSLHRSGAAGMARYGGWFWSGDIDSTWSTLAAQVSVGLAASLSVSPFWGTDIGGFVPRKEYTGELFVRWFQFAAFTPSFRSHGRSWHLHLPWGWNTGGPGPIEGTGEPGLIEGKELCDASEFHNAQVEPACREMLNLRYRLLPYNYTLAREACDAGLPMMRALWLHYPDDAMAVAREDEYLWGSNLLVAPVLAKGASERKVYLPRGLWFDWCTSERREGGREITRSVDLATIPLFVRAGSIIPLDPVRQFTAEPVAEPTELRIYPGADAEFTLYDDDGHSMDYRENDGCRIRMAWNDAAKTLTLEPANNTAGKVQRTFKLRVVSDNISTTIEYCGAKLTKFLATR